MPLRAGSLIWAQISASVLPSHAISRGARCQIGLPGHAAGLEIGLLVADRAAHRREAISVRPAFDRRLMEPAGVALARAVAGRMAIHAARMGQHLAELGETMPPTAPRVSAIAAKLSGLARRVRRAFGDGVGGQHARQQAATNENLKATLRSSNSVTLGAGTATNAYAR